MSAIWLGNLTTNEACMVDITSLNNPSQWKYHDGAYITEKQQIIKEVTFRDLDPFIITTDKTIPIKDPQLFTEQDKDVKKTTPSNNKVLGAKEKPEKTKQDPPTVEWVNYAAYGKCTVDDLDYLLKSLIHTHNFYGRKPPGPATKSAMVHSQELSAFRDGYTIREIRDLGLRIKHTPNSMSEKCTYQTILRRVIQAMVWWGRPVELKLLKEARER